jgi:hypothetical protein
LFEHKPKKQQKKFSRFRERLLELTETSPLQAFQTNHFYKTWDGKNGPRGRLDRHGRRSIVEARRTEWNESKSLLVRMNNKYICIHPTRITVFCDFCQFSAKKLAFFFSNTNVKINFFQKLALVWVKKADFWNFFGKNIFKIMTSVPGANPTTFEINVWVQNVGYSCDGHLCICKTLWPTIMVKALQLWIWYSNKRGRSLGISPWYETLT